MAGITRAQHDVLLLPIKPHRVSQSEGQSHVESYDVRAHLNRIFGFGEWSGDVLDMTLLFEQEATLKSGKAGWRVGYRCTYRLTIHATGATYTETATGDGSMPDSKRADAHDFAVKTAESQALKRCAINLGDQFGLSLYNGGSLMPLVGTSLVAPGTSTEHLAHPAKDVDSHITAPLAPEDAPDRQAEPETTTPPPPRETPAGRAANPDVVADIREKALAEDATKVQLAKLLARAGKEGVAGALTTDGEGKGMTLETVINKRIRQVA